MRGMIPTESQDQQAVIAWFDRYASLRLLNPCLLFAIPNGSVLAGDSRRRAMQMARMKKEGVRVGVPDLFLAVARGGYHGLFIENKRKNWKAPLSGQAFDEWFWRLQYHDLLRLSGYRVEVCVGADACMSVIMKYLTLK